MNAIDTNVLVYFVDEYEPTRQAEATGLLEQLAEADEQTVILWQVAVEFLSCLRRWENDGRISRTTTWDYVAHLEQTFPIVMPSRSILRRALDLSSRFSLSHWDSVLLAACIDAGVDRLFSEDLTDGMRYDSVKVVNPFLPSHPKTA